jgi:hypothetical protein
MGMAPLRGSRVWQELQASRSRALGKAWIWIEGRGSRRHHGSPRSVAKQAPLQKGVR